MRGMTHVVTKVNSQTSINVAPDFRGVTSISGAKMAKVKDTQKQDKINGIEISRRHWQSGYNLDMLYAR